MRRTQWLGGLTGLALLAAAAAAAAPLAAQTVEHSFVNLGPITLAGDASAGAGMFWLPHAQFGAGSYDQRLFGAGGAPYRASRSPDPIWGEFWVKPGLLATWQLDSLDSLIARISGVYAQTVGDGDADLNTYTPGNPGSVAAEEAYLAYTTELPFGGTGDTLVATFGKQNFVVDDGFLIADGTYDAGNRGAFYLGPRTAFDGWGTLKFNSAPVRGDIFVLRNTVDNHLLKNANVDYPLTNFAGFDTQWFQNAPAKGADGRVNYADREKYVGLTYFHVYDAHLGATTPGTFAGTLIPVYDRQDMDVMSLDTGGHPLQGLNLPLGDDLTFYGQTVFERRGQGTRLEGGSQGPGINAYAFYVEPGYDLTNLPWQPHLYARYLRFSGPHDTAGAHTGYDPLFVASPGLRGTFGTFFLGEIIGQYVQSNTNEHVEQIGVTLNPAFHLLQSQDSLKFDVIAYNFTYDKRPPGVQAKHLAQEVDTIAEYQYDPETSVDAAFGVAFPGRGVSGYNRSTLASAGADTDSINLGRTSLLFEAFITKNF